MREAERVVRTDREDDVRWADGAQECVGRAGAAAVVTGLEDIGPQIAAWQEQRIDSDPSSSYLARRIASSTDRSGSRSTVKSCQ